MRLKRFILRYRLYLISIALALLGYYLSLPSPLFHDPYSTVLEDFQGELLSASIAADGQWRFPELTATPEKFQQALITFEDKRFRSHPGVDILSIGRAISQNFKAGKIIRGGSTITMQVVRLSRKGKARTIYEKLIESILATRIELRYSKIEILSLYASHAPFGGNVVGLEAACWRYFGRDPQELSWAEASLLAVLPNSPALIHPGKNREKLLLKRDGLLKKLKETKVIDQITYDLAIHEPIPEEPRLLPRYAKHLLSRGVKDGLQEKKIRSTIQISLQQNVERILEDHHQRLKGNQVFNASAIVLDVETGSALAYVGNVNTDANHNRDVDVIAAPRSTGSILKPFLFAALLDDGKMLSKTLVPDIPTVINGFAPKNFSKEYDGAVPADKALIRSLNVPAVYMLRDYRYERFHQLLKNIGMNSLTKPADYYGLALVLGGAEGTLWDITGIYASMSRTLNHYFEHPGKKKYTRLDFHGPIYLQESRGSSSTGTLEESSYLSAASIYQTFDALKEVYRPGEETGWRYFTSSKKIAWKTGTSFGFRDGWAVGVTPQYVVGVWVGNADGEGRPGLTGTETAAPIMFDIFSQLTAGPWFKEPLQEMKKVLICSKSGHRLSTFCEIADTVWINNSGLETVSCTYHKLIHLSKDSRYQVNSGCESLPNINEAKWFVLPPVQEYYYKSRNLSYKNLPPFRGDCQGGESQASMDLIYPKENARIFIPHELNGAPGKSIFELVHRNSKATIYWHLDGVFVSETRTIHHLELNPVEGKHVLTIVDNAGKVLERHFEIISKL